MMPLPDEYRRLAESGVLDEIGEELRRELFVQWQGTAGVEEREQIFFRAMAILDIADAIKARAKKRLEVVNHDAS